MQSSIAKRLNVLLVKNERLVIVLLEKECTTLLRKIVRTLIKVSRFIIIGY